ncbi:MAG: RHS repeat-associated core domain-containing protein, partial [Thermoleophilia bacterium]
LQRDILDESGKNGVYKGFPFGKDAIGTNLYAWCGNNPVTRVDPSGRAGLLDWIRTAASVAVALVNVAVNAVSNVNYGVGVALGNAIYGGARRWARNNGGAAAAIETAVPATRKLLGPVNQPMSGKFTKQQELKSPDLLGRTLGRWGRGINDPTGMFAYPNRPVDSQTWLKTILMVLPISNVEKGISKIGVPALEAGYKTFDAYENGKEAWDIATSIDDNINPRSCTYCHYWSNHIEEIKILGRGQWPTNGWGPGSEFDWLN